MCLYPLLVHGDGGRACGCERASMGLRIVVLEELT